FHGLARRCVNGNATSRVGMLTRGFHDAIVVWPVIFWPILFSSCFFAFFQLCRSLNKHYGVSPLHGRRPQDFAVLYGAVPAAAMIEVTAHAYMFYIVGYVYLVVAIPIYVFGWILLPWVLDGFRPGLPLLGGIYALFTASFAVLLGFWDFGPLRAMNADIYGLLTGVPAAI
ncbi:MAG: hypothetical protein AAF439_12845, partial [Pseudomonadota bacterium]